jgi:hypothetical protein
MDDQTIEIERLQIENQTIVEDGMTQMDHFLCKL